MLAEVACFDLHKCFRVASMRIQFGNDVSCNNKRSLDYLYCVFQKSKFIVRKAFLPEGKRNLADYCTIPNILQIKCFQLIVVHSIHEEIHPAVVPGQPELLRPPVGQQEQSHQQRNREDQSDHGDHVLPVTTRRSHQRRRNVLLRKLRQGFLHVEVSIGVAYG